MDKEYVLVKKADLMDILSDIINDQIDILKGYKSKKKISDDIISKAEAKEILSTRQVLMAERKGYLVPFQQAGSSRSYYKRSAFDAYVMGKKSLK